MNNNIKLWKLTDQLGQTKNHTQWGPNIEHTASGEGGLCSAGWLHAYEGDKIEGPLLALLLNPIGANIQNPKLWAAEGDIRKRDRQLKCGCTRLKTLYEVPLPEISLLQIVAFAINCAKEIYKKPIWLDWANNWLNGADRTKEAAYTASYAAYTASYAAYAAYAASNAAYAAHDTSNAAYAAYTAAYAASYVSDAAYAAYASYAAYTAAYAVNLLEIAKKTMEKSYII